MRGNRRRLETSNIVIVKHRSNFVAWLALLGLVLAQLTTAAYACPLIESSLRGSPSVPQAQMAGPCDGMAMDQPVTMTTPCLEHCNVGLQLVATHSPSDHLSYLPSGVFLVVALPTTSSSVESPTAPLLARAASPPVFASSNRLRI
jgi:hypothetical protein